MMIPKKRNLSRRSVLKGAGVAMGLPWLEAMTPAAFGASSAAAPVRMAVLYMANGVNTSVWTPEGKGRDFKLSPTLAPLQDLKDQLVVVSNLWNAAANTGDGHYVKESSLLTCTTISKTLGVDINMHGVSMDQVAAQRIGDQTPLPSLELGIEPESTGVDANVGYTRVYGSHIAWSSPTTPLAREINPRSVYERLFRASGPQGNTVKQDTQLLDRVLEHSKKLRSEVGSADQARIDEYLSIVRSLEQRMDRASDPKRNTWKPRASMAGVAKPTDAPRDHTEHVRLMLDLIAVAFQTDTTRISTFMFGNAVSGVNFRFLEGVSSSHHEVSHHSKDPEKLQQYALINRWHIEQYGYLLRKLRDMKEGDGNVLDNSMILFGSALSDGNSHNPHKLPLVLGGKGGGRIATGQHLVYTEDSPAANLYVSMLDACGTPVERFADSTGPLPGLLA
ncbi:DUF1552 domain-containing protein [Bryobacter aggregatus]|uniref:DUF1552 domain-containing protein n=1 Tax=Bryobacter aggregatus TaxID=360054 RepID=UPI000A632517|nr:DUF1552 domain-containing protein [Bryobacter aggregatus]